MRNKKGLKCALLHYHGDSKLKMVVQGEVYKYPSIVFIRGYRIDDKYTLLVSGMSIETVVNTLQNNKHL